jgi:hypothetical protein
MTREERNIKLKHYITCLECECSGKACEPDCDIQFKAGNFGEIIENLKAISEIIEQQPCEDVVSRQTVKEAICDYVCGKDIRCVANHECNMKKLISELPSVTPKEKIIHCKDCKYRDYWGDCTKWSKELDAHKSYILDENMFCGFAEFKAGDTDGNLNNDA